MANKKRSDDFTQAVKDTLAARAGHRCSNPECNVMTIGPGTGAGKVNLGVAAHICAASPNGPRYDESQSSEERASANNGIWLCENCAHKIDHDNPTHLTYPVALLRKWKKERVSKAQSELGRDAQSLTEVAGSHTARGVGNITGLDIQGPAIIQPGTKVVAEGRGNITGTRIGGG